MIIKKREQEFPNLFIDHKERGRYSKLNITITDVMQYLACHMWLHAKGKNKGEGIIESLSRTKGQSERLTGIKLVGLWKLRKVLSICFLCFTADKEGQLAVNMKACLKFIRQTLCGYKKLFTLLV